MTNANRAGLIVEICIDSVEGMIAAKNAGAARVELCSALLEGGLTPSYGIVKRAISVSNAVAVQVMIRPRGGDFLYTDDEFAVMKEDIAALKALGVDGFVFGLLNADGSFDSERTAQLIELGRPASITVHRAFDMALDPFETLDTLIELGVDRLLTSGQAPSVLEGAPLIRQLIEQAAGRMVIMPGGDITARNAARIVAETDASEIHFAVLEIQPGPMRHRNPDVFMGGTLRPPEYDRTLTSEAGIARVIDAVRSS
ncbi:MAG: copper homeostasis protein CutC [Rhizobiaceae bacterium]